MNTIPQPELGDCDIECFASPYPRDTCTCHCQGSHHGIREAAVAGMGPWCGEYETPTQFVKLVVDPAGRYHIRPLNDPDLMGDDQ